MHWHGQAIIQIVGWYDLSFTLVWRWYDEGITQFEHWHWHSQVSSQFVRWYDRTPLSLYAITTKASLKASLSGKTSYCKISWNFESMKFDWRFFQSLWNLTGTSAAALPRCLSNCRAIWSLKHPISRLRVFMGFGGKTSYRLVNRLHADNGMHCMSFYILVDISFLYHRRVVCKNQLITAMVVTNFRWDRVLYSMAYAFKKWIKDN